MSNPSLKGLLGLAWLVAIAGTPGTAGVAGTGQATGSATLTVGARVRPVVRLDRLAAPASLTLTETDLARGWVDLTEPLELEVRANTSGGWDLGLDLDTDVVLAVGIGGLSPDPVLAGQGARFGPPVTGPGRTPLSLALRLYLGPGARAGLQPFPLRFTAAPRPEAPPRRG